MPVRRAFLVIGGIAIVGIVGAVVLRQTHGPANAPSSFSANASEAVSADTFLPRSISPSIFGSDERAPAPSGDLLAQAVPAAAAPRVVMPGPPAASDGSAATPTVPAQVAQPQAEAAPAATQPPPAGPQVDETALRYFARQGDTKRLNAEIARLKALYPDWFPPTDMTAPVAIPDPLLDQMWKYYSDGQYAAARAAIADRQAREPAWQVPADLLKRLDIGEARERLINAAGAKQWNTVVAIAAATPSLLTCSDVDILWRLSEAFAMTERSGRARDVGIYVLTNCLDPKERLATVQKAMPYLSDAEMNELMALERPGADGAGEFAPVKADLARRRVGAAAKDPKLSASPEDLVIVEQLARDGSKADDAVLLAGYLFQHGDAEQAAKWYELAKTRADTPDIARGLAYAYNALKRPAEAEAAAYRWREDSPENKEAYLVVATALLAIDPPVKLEADVLARMAKTISDAKYYQGAQELGWYAYNTGQTLAAARWFTAALTWNADDEPSAYGLALAYDKLGNKSAFQKVLRVWGQRSERIALLADPKARRAGRPAASELPMPPSIADPGDARRGAVDGGAPAAGIEAASADYLVPSPRADGALEVAPRAVAVRPAPATRTASTGNAPAPGGRCGGTARTDQLAGMSAVNRGWCLLDLNRPIEAADAFDAAMRSSEGRTREDAAYGKTLANLRAGLTDSAAISAAEAPQSPKRATEMRIEILTQRALGAYADARYVETLFYLDERSRLAPEQNDLLMVRGWAYYHLHRLPEAKRIFVAVAGTGSREALRALAALASDPSGRNLSDGRDRR